MSSKLPENLFAYPHIATATMKTEDIQEVLLKHGGWVMAQGRLWDICVDDIGAGVCKVSLRLRKVTTSPLPAIVRQLKCCGFECEAGPLELNTAFIALEALKGEG